MVYMSKKTMAELKYTLVKVEPLKLILKGKLLKLKLAVLLNVKNLDNLLVARKALKLWEQLYKFLIHDFLMCTQKQEDEFAKEKKETLLLHFLM